MTKITGKQISPIAFKAYRSATYNTTANANTSGFVFDSVVYNFGTGYNAATGNFIAPVPGVYAFKVGVFTETGSMIRTFISPRYTGGVDTSKNADRIIDLSAPSSGGDGIARIQGVLDIYLTAGQGVGFEIWTSSSVNLASPNTWFSGFLVGQA